MYYTIKELSQIVFKKIGINVRISKNTSLINTENISLGNHIRIDDFCILSAGRGGINIQDYVHVGPYSCLIGRENITLEDFVGISSRVAIYSSNDDYSGESLTGPLVAEEFRNVASAPVILRRHVIVGCGAVILPGVEMGVGSALGALSLARKECEAFQVYFGCPARSIGPRSDKLLEIEIMMKNTLRFTK